MRGSEAAPARIAVLAIGCCVACLWACGAPALAPLQGQSLPEHEEARGEAAEELGRTLFGALRQQGVGPLLADGATLDALYVSAERGRLLAEQADSRRRFAAPPWAGVWDDHEYAGICVQASQLSSEVHGLREPAFVVDRALVVARRGTWRSAAWVTGTFVLTNQGFRTIAVSEVEQPRPNHADLELAPCDVQRGF